MAGLLKGKEIDEFSEQYASWEIMLERLTGNVVISEVEAVMMSYLARHKNMCFMGNYLMLQNVASHYSSSLQPTSTAPTVYSLLVSATVVCHLQVKISPTLNTNDKEFFPASEVSVLSTTHRICNVHLTLSVFSSEDGKPQQINSSLAHQWLYVTVTGTAAITNAQHERRET
jgi:hypothetical protein